MTWRQVGCRSWWLKLWEEEGDRVGVGGEELEEERLEYCLALVVKLRQKHAVVTY